MIYWEKLRTEIGRYADGVHELGPPLASLPSLPEGLRALYRSFDGLRLFTDSFIILPAAEVSKGSQGRWRVGESLGAPLEMDAAGRLYEIDDAGEALQVGSSLPLWLDAVLAREKMVVDREGEYKEVFGDGGELNDEIRWKRARAGLKADPDAAAWHMETAELSFEAGREAEACEELLRAVALDERAGAAWILLGGLHERAQKPEEAAEAYARAADASGDAERRAERYAEAARMTCSPERRARWAADSRAADAGAAVRWLADAERRLADDPEGALRLAQLAEATGADAREVLKRARLKAQLRVF